MTIDTLEALHIAERSIEERFEYSDWRYCACGHIYKATRASGHFAAKQSTITVSRNKTFQRVIDEVATALGWEGFDEDGDRLLAIDYVSNYVSDTAGTNGTPYRPAAKQVFREAITEIERTRAMDIGKPIRTVRIEPAKEPVPEREERRDVPNREPAKAPERDPATVPSR